MATGLVGTLGGKIVADEVDEPATPGLGGRPYLGPEGTPLVETPGRTGIGAVDVLSFATGDKGAEGVGSGATGLSG